MFNDNNDHCNSKCNNSKNFFSGVQEASPRPFSGNTYQEAFTNHGNRGKYSGTVATLGNLKKHDFPLPANLNIPKRPSVLPVNPLPCYLMPGNN